MSKRTYVLHTPLIRENACRAIIKAEPGYVVTIGKRTRSGEQNDKLHALLSDLAKSPMTWMGKRRTLHEWKMLMVSAHAVATQQPGEVIPGIEGEFVAIRESTASMGVARASSLIEYVLAFCVSNGVELHDTERGGWLQDRSAA